MTGHPFFICASKGNWVEKALDTEKSNNDAHSLGVIFICFLRELDRKQDHILKYP